MPQAKRLVIDNKNILCYEVLDSDIYNGRYDLFNIPYAAWYGAGDVTKYQFLQDQLSYMHDYDIRSQIYNRYNAAVNFTLLDEDSQSVGAIKFPVVRKAYVTAATGGTQSGAYAMKADWYDYPDPNQIGITCEAWMKFEVLCTGFTNTVNNKVNFDGITCQLIKNGTTRTFNLPAIVYSINSWQDGYVTWYGDDWAAYGLLTFAGLGNTTYINSGCFTPAVMVIHDEKLDIDNQIVLPSDSSGYWAVFSSGWGQAIDISDVVNLEGEPIPEEGYMNELMNRFSPRQYAGTLGIYLIGTDDIAAVMQAMMEVDVSDVLANIFFGSDGKEYIVGCRWYYGLLQESGHTQGHISQNEHKYEIKVGNHRLDLNGAPIYAYIADKEFATWTSSELSVPAHFNNYLDFMSRYQLYIPYYGFLDIAANDIVGGTIQLIYNINLVSGVADIVVACKNSRTGSLKTKYYTVTARLGIDIPFGSDMMKTLVLNWAQTCGKAFATGATLGAGMAVAGAMENISQANTALSNVNLDTEEGRMAANNIVKARDASQAEYNRAQFARSIIGDINVKSVDTPNRSGGTNDESGSLDELHPYLLITRPVSVEPSNYEDYVGVPSAASKKLSTCSGFTQIAAVKPEALTNPPKYVNEILSLLQSGVYL